MDWWRHKYFDYRHYFVAVVVDIVVAVDFDGVIARNNFGYFYRQFVARHKSVVAAAAVYHSVTDSDSIGLNCAAVDKLAHCVIAHNQSVVELVAAADFEKIYLELSEQSMMRVDQALAVV